MFCCFSVVLQSFSYVSLVMLSALIQRSAHRSGGCLSRRLSICLFIYIYIYTIRNGLLQGLAYMTCMRSMCSWHGRWHACSKLLVDACMEIGGSDGHCVLLVEHLSRTLEDHRQSRSPQLSPSALDPMWTYTPKLSCRTGLRQLGV